MEGGGEICGYMWLEVTLSNHFRPDFEGDLLQIKKAFYDPAVLYKISFMRYIVSKGFYSSRTHTDGYS